MKCEWLKRLVMGLLFLGVSAPILGQKKSPRYHWPQQVLPQEELSVSRLDLGVNQLNLARYRFPHLQGQGLTASLKEARFDSLDLDLLGRYLPGPHSSVLVADHATIMASIIGGAGNTFYSGRGVAPQVKLSSASFFLIGPEPIAYFTDFGISVQNHSYGLEIENRYGESARDYDQLAHQLPDLLQVFSAGNRGDAPAMGGRYAEMLAFSNLTGTFKQAKNILTIGSVDSFLQVEALSSRGPAYDGRVKPELVAFGEDGSSGAAALTSGISLLLQQSYFNQHDSLPPAALVKATLIAGAQDLLSPGPDYRSGYGNIQAARSLEMIENGRFLMGEIAEGQSQAFSFELQEGVQDLRIVLCWTDLPAPIDAPSALVNDLDLSLSLPDSARSWLPWVLSDFPAPDSLLTPARRRIDTLNPQELLSLEQAPAGRYQIQVTGRKVAERQAFSIAMDWEATERFTWEFPVRNDYVRADRKNVLRWRSTLASETGTLAYRLALPGENWHEIAAQLALEQGFIPWEIPDLFAPVNFRMIAGADTFYSDTFLVSRPMTLGQELNCENEIVISWSPQPGAQGYIVAQFQDTAWKPLGITSDTVWRFEPPLPTPPWLAITPLTAQGRKGIQSPLTNLDFLNTGCYLQSFLLEDRGDTALLKVQLSTLLQILEIQFEKEREGNWETLFSVAPQTKDLEYADYLLHPGLNRYRAIVFLQSGEQIVSEEQWLIFAPSGEWLLFPNPAALGEDVIIQSRGLEGSWLVLYDQWGRKVEELQIDVETEFLFTDLLSKGIYYYRISREGEALGEGKLWVK